MMRGASRSRALPADVRNVPTREIRRTAGFSAIAFKAYEMKLEVRIGTFSQELEVQRAGPHQFTITDSAQIDAIEVAPNTYSILVNGRAFEAVVIPEPDGVLVRFGGQEFRAIVSDPRRWRGRRSTLFSTEGKRQVLAPMPGKVVRILVSAGQTVEVDQGLVVVEAMKMQNEIRAPKAGKIERIFIGEGQAVAAGESLLTIT